MHAAVIASIHADQVSVPVPTPCRTPTAVRRISVTARAPRVVYQRSVSGTGQCEAPETTTPLPDEDELTPLEGWRLLEELDELDDVDEVEDVEVAVDDDVDEVAVVVPGMVAAPIPPKMPTPANAPMALSAVKRLSARNAASRANARVRSMVDENEPGD